MVELETLSDVLDRLKGMRVKRVGWFGLSADPPTKAHEKIVAEVLRPFGGAQGRQGLVDCVVVFVSGRQDGKEYYASDEDRWRMSELGLVGLIDGSEFGGQILLSRFDLEKRVAWRWMELWEEITSRSSKQGNSFEHWFIVGSDQWEVMEDEWYRGKELKEVGRFIVVPRTPLCRRKSASSRLQGGALDWKEFEQPDSVKFLDIEWLEGSSTEVREGEFGFVNERVKKYIVDNGLYRGFAG